MQRTAVSRLVLVLCLFSPLLLPAAPACADSHESAIDGSWEGAIQTPGPALEFDVDFVTAEDGTLSGDISIPVQSLADLGLTDVSFDAGSGAVTFTIPGIPGTPSFSGNLSEDGASIAGTFTQGGASLDFAMQRAGDRAAKARAALEGFDAVVAQAIADFNVPGVAIGIVAGGEVVYAKGFGQRDREQELPVTADTLFAIGSTTKAFTATLLGMLVDDGKLDWDAPLRTYLPTFTLKDPVADRLITPRDLVTHRSGLPRHDLLWYNNNDDSRAEMVARLAHLEPSAAFRAKFQYNNLMFMTAGYLAGQLTGSTWEEALRARILAPLGMERTTFAVSASQRDEDHALPYRENDDDVLERIPFRAIDTVGPAGSLNSSVAEMSRWLLFNLNGGKHGEERLIAAATLADIHSPHMTTGESQERPEISQSTYGMGWGIDTYRGHRRVAHGGGIDGFITAVGLFPDDGIGIVAFTNRGSGLPGLLAQTAADRLLDLEPIDWLGEAKKRAEQGEALAEEGEKKKAATRVDGTAPSHPIADYAGDYLHPGYGTLRIDHDPDTDALALVYNGITAPLEHWHYDVWNGAETDGDPSFKDSKLQFRANLDGLIATVESVFEPTVDPIVFAKGPPAELSDPEHLARLAGRYALPGQVVTISLAGGKLVVDLPGQPRYTLEPDLSGRFVLAELTIISVGFSFDGEGDSDGDGDGKATAVTFYQPNGVFEAKRVD